MLIALNAQDDVEWAELQIKVTIMLSLLTAHAHSILTRHKALSTISRGPSLNSVIVYFHRRHAIAFRKDSIELTSFSTLYDFLFFKP